MSSDPPADTAPKASPDSLPSAVGGPAERSVGQMREEFGSTVTGLKQKYGTLLEQRDLQIRDLADKLAKGPPKEPKRRMLIVDDAGSTGEMVNHYLEGYPVDVVYVAAAQARDRLGSEEYDVILVEAAGVIDPGMDGLALGRQLCESGDQQSVVVMSSRPGDRIKNLVEADGAIFLRKPFRRSQLLELMRGALRKEKE